MAPGRSARRQQEETAVSSGTLPCAELQKQRSQSHYGKLTPQRELAHVRECVCVKRRELHVMFTSNNYTFFF